MKKPLLKFSKSKGVYNVFNHEFVFLGEIKKIKVGRFMHWAFHAQEETYYTSGCMKEIIEFMAKLYREDMKKWKKRVELTNH